MPWRFSEQHLTDYHHHHVTVFRGILQPSLVHELRQAGEEVERISYARRGTAVSRSPSLGQLREDLSPTSWRAFEAYRDDPDVVDAIQRVLSPEHRHGDLTQLCLFLSEQGPPVVQDWHRDLAEGHPGVDDDEFARVKLDPLCFAQINCALYTDVCLWFVPGSAGRPDTQGELTAAGPAYNGLPGRGRILNPELEGLIDAQRERICRDYCEAMPGAVNLLLEAGDLALYRPIAWHTGFYAPHRKRLTLHDTADSPRQQAWHEARRRRLAQTDPA